MSWKSTEVPGGQWWVSNDSTQCSTPAWLEQLSGYFDANGSSCRGSGHNTHGLRHPLFLCHSFVHAEMMLGDRSPQRTSRPPSPKPCAALRTVHPLAYIQVRARCYWLCAMKCASLTHRDVRVVPVTCVPLRAHHSQVTALVLVHQVPLVAPPPIWQHVLHRPACFKG